jgi:signal peptidase I
MLVGALLVLAFFGAIGVGSFALVNGTWTVNPVLSGSMRPGLSVGGVVIGERIPVNSLRVRDVILFRSPNNSSDQVVHRIIHIAKGSSGQLLINTQGDANTVRDPWTLTIRGRYAFRARWAVPLLGYVAVAFQNHRGISIIVAGFVLIVIAFTSVIQSRRRDGDKRKSDAELIAFQEFPISGRHLRRSDDRAPESVQNEIQQSSK